MIPVLFLIMSAVYAQSAESPVPNMDNTVKALAQTMHGKLIEKKAQKIAVGQFFYQGTLCPLSAYWANQLTGELVNNSNRPYLVLSERPQTADWVIAGEILVMPDMIRIYTRLIRSEDRAIEAVCYANLERLPGLLQMLVSSGGSSGSGASVAMDEWEPDSWDQPVPYEISVESPVVLSRTLHGENDEDFFLIVPDRDGRLVMETTGRMDTRMEFYTANSRALLSENDDGGSGSNARIGYTVRAGSRYIAIVRGYSNDTTGNYGFRAHFSDAIVDEYEPDNDQSQAKMIEIVTTQVHTFTDGDDVDWVKFQVARSGRHVIRVGGVNSNDLDTTIQLFDEDHSAMAENDDGGENLSSLLSIRLMDGTYYLRVRCLDDDPDQPYSIRIDAE